jgi:transposase
VIADPADTSTNRVLSRFPRRSRLGSRKEPTPYDKHRYKKRRLVECLINKIRPFRHVTTRYNKIVASFLGFVAIAAFIAEAIADLVAVGKRFAGSMRPSRRA